MISCEMLQAEKKIAGKFKLNIKEIVIINK